MALKILCWNVNGIRAAQRKGFLDWFKKEKPDFLAVQETKARAEQLDEELVKVKDYHVHYFSAERPGYSGTAIFSREKPDEIWEGIGKKEFDCEGRVLGARYGKLHLISAYYPNSQDGGKRLDYKVRFCKQVEAKMKQLIKKGHDIVLCGDYNIAHTEIDLARPEANEQNAGYFPEERKAMTDFLKAGFIDIFREQNPGVKDQYTWWSFRGGARARNVGWRIDYTNISVGLKSRAKKAFHYRNVMGSDHCPIGLTLK